MKMDSNRMNLAIIAVAALFLLAAAGMLGASGQPEKEGVGIEDKEYTMSWLIMGSIPLDEDAEMIQYWSDYYEVDIQAVWVDSAEFDQIFGVKLAAGEIPDWFHASQRQMENYYKNDILAAIPDPVLRQYLPCVYRELEGDLPGIMRYGYIDGKRYGIPTSTHSMTGLRRQIVFRGDWLQNVGITEVPDTLAEYEESFYAFRNNDPDRNGKKDTYGLSQTMLEPIYGAFGYLKGFWHERDGKLVCGDVQPEMKDALRLLNKWYTEEVLDPEFITGENTGGYWGLSQHFINGRIGTSALGNSYHWSPDVPGRSAGANYVECKKKSEEMVESLVFAPPPVGPNGDRGMPMQNAFAGNYRVFGKQIEDEPDKMGKILQIFDDMICGDKDRYLTAFLGIKGKHWEYGDDGLPVQLGKFTDHRELQRIGAWGSVANFGFQKVFMYRMGPFYEWARENNFDKWGYANTLPPFVSLPARTKYQTELNKIRDETYTAIISGYQPVDSFDEFVARWRKAGGDELTAQANDWYGTLKMGH